MSQGEARYNSAAGSQGEARYSYAAASQGEARYVLTLRFERLATVCLVRAESNGLLSARSAQ